jgi:hypothetical protein
MLYPKVLGQSGTAIPTSLLVTKPPNPMRTNVANAVTMANRCNHGVFCGRADIKNEANHQKKQVF